jgi:hypothetical protein
MSRQSAHEGDKVVSPTHRPPLLPSSPSQELFLVLISVGPGTSVGIATDYGLDGLPDLIPVGARFFAHVQTGPGAHPASWTRGTGSFPEVKRPECGADHPPLLAPRLRKSRAIPLLPL